MHSVQITTDWDEKVLKAPFFGTAVGKTRKKVYRVVVQLTKAYSSRFISQQSYSSWESARRAADRIIASSGEGTA